MSALALTRRETLGVARRDVRVVAGECSRSKVVDVDGVGPTDVERLTSERR